MHNISSPGKIYVIDVEAHQAGIPYADSFFIFNHFCLVRMSDSESRLSVYSQIKYKKSVWGLVKTFIEKNTWAGMEDFYQSMSKSLLVEAEALLAGEASAAAVVKRKNRIARHRRVRAGHNNNNANENTICPAAASSGDSSPNARTSKLKMCALGQKNNPKILSALVSQFVGSDRPMNAADSPTCCSWSNRLCLL